MYNIEIVLYFNTNNLLFYKKRILFMNTINSVIKFDLHIHSNASAYKEANGIVAQSTKENLDVLFDKLNQYQVSLFAITDHNRFDADLYKAIKQKLLTDKEKYPKNALAGIEFDVQLEEEKGKCHIIAIFDANEENCDQITNGLAAVKELDKPEQVYTREEFEKILRQIDLNVILIAEQRKGITNKKGGETSLSDSVENVESILKVGYFNAVEVQKNHVEGILLNDLHELNCKITIFCGSDCHEWAAYPKHDQTVKDCPFEPSQAKMLPTFKGLLMALTSPNTRFDCVNSNKKPILSEISINNIKFPLVMGLNAIIGENGSGKTTLLEIINGHTKKNHIKNLQKANNIEFTKSLPNPNFKYIEQGQIVKDYQDGKLLSNEEFNNFEQVDDTKFISTYRKYAEQLKTAIFKNIETRRRKEQLKLFKFELKEPPTINPFYISVFIPPNFQNFSNTHQAPLSKINALIEQVQEYANEPYFIPYKEIFSQIETLLSNIKKTVATSYEKNKSEIEVKNMILSHINEYERQNGEKSTRKAKEAESYKQEKNQLISDICDVIKDKVTPNVFPNFPPPLEGCMSKKKQGFSFISRTKYHEKDLLEDFCSYMFKKKFQTLEEIKKIDSKKILGEDVIHHCTKQDDIENHWENNLSKFLEDLAQPTKIIMDDKEVHPMGNTLGEMSLVYYKLHTFEKNSWDVLIIDQPEDNISNSNIKKNLISYLHSIQKGKQILFVTHNPLLVVNLDVDNVICLRKENDKIKADGGCLEYEDGNENINILNIIAENMDGGTDAIERRLKAYGKNY